MVKVSNCVLDQSAKYVEIPLLKNSLTFYDEYCRGMTLGIEVGAILTKEKKLKILTFFFWGGGGAVKTSIVIDTAESELGGAVDMS